MRRYMFAAALWLTSTLIPTTADAAVPEYESAYAGESAFLTITGGQSGQFQVFFMNTGAATWRKGTESQVNLVVCLPNKTTCNVDSPNADWNDGSWLSSRTYARQTQTDVGPREIASFVYSVRAPLTISSGIWRFNGDLVLASAGRLIRPEGYYQEASCACERFEPPR
jgi:hypothetical protein